MSEYEREWVSSRGLPDQARLRTGLTTRGGTPLRFLLQLEAWTADDWSIVARFEHAAEGPLYRNVEYAGLHLDIHHPSGAQVAKRTHWPPMPAKRAMVVAEDYLRDNAQRLVRRFEAWR